MTIEADLYALLSPLVGGRVFPDVAPFNTERPFVTYQQVGGRVINPLDNSAPGKENSFIQINVWAATRASANALSRAIEDAMRAAAAFVARPDSALIAQHEPDLNLYGAMQDFSIWSSR